MVRKQQRPPVTQPPLPDEGQLETSVVTITPAMAVEMLNRGGLNRPIKQFVVDRYASDMRNGEWRLTGETVKLDKNGLVRDGQHRLFACIESEVAFKTLVAINVPDDAFDVMDSGYSRSNADILALHGFENARQSAACARYSILLEQFGTFLSDGRTIVSKPQVVRWMEQNPKAERWVKEGRRLTRKNGISGGESLWAAILYRLAKIDENDAATFAEKIASGAALDNGNPILALRSRLAITRDRRDRLSANETAALAFKAWNVWRRGQTVQVLVWRRGGTVHESFPVPV